VEGCVGGWRREENIDGQDRQDIPWEWGILMDFVGGGVCRGVNVWRPART
jgi:hypothetical protein